MNNPVKTNQITFSICNMIKSVPSSWNNIWRQKRFDTCFRMFLIFEQFWQNCIAIIWLICGLLELLHTMCKFFSFLQLLILTTQVVGYLTIPYLAPSVRSTGFQHCEKFRCMRVRPLNFVWLCNIIWAWCLMSRYAFAEVTTPHEPPSLMFLFKSRFCQIRAQMC